MYLRNIRKAPFGAAQLNQNPPETAIVAPAQQ
jgi:hypothetical protein